MSIPTISDEELKRRYKQIKPVLTVNGKLYYFRKFTFSEIVESNYLQDINIAIQKEVGENELEVWKDHDIHCLHSFTYPQIFNPTIKEVLAQLKPQDIPFIKAFEIVERPLTFSDFYKNIFTSTAFKDGFHVSTVRLYRKKSWQLKIKSAKIADFIFSMISFKEVAKRLILIIFIPILHGFFKPFNTRSFLIFFSSSLLLI